jgi:preprotein translocase subunit SecB
MQRSPLDLQHYHFNKLDIQAAQGSSQSQQGKGPYPSFDGVDFSANVQISSPPDQSSPFQFGLKLKLKCKPKQSEAPFPYAFEVEAEGFYKVSAATEDDARKIVVINGSAVLYSAIREQMLTLTGRFPQGPMMLPTVNFLNLFSPKQQAPKDQPPKTAKVEGPVEVKPRRTRKKSAEA